MLTLADHNAMLAGFEGAGFVRVQAQALANPLNIEWHVDGAILRFRLWAFDVTHGGGQRAEAEFRIQITNGPATMADFDSGNAIDLLVGYSRAQDAIVAYDRRWLEAWTNRGGGSPSVQVKEADIQAGHAAGFHHLTKSVRFGMGDIVTMNPSMLPAYLLNEQQVLRGIMSAQQATATLAAQTRGSIVDYCRSRGFVFEPDLIARYLASALAKPFVILAGVSGTGKSKLAELVAEYYAVKPISGSTSGASAASAPTGPAHVFVPKMVPDPTRFALVPVRPDWIDSQAILGFTNPITESYESTQALDLILRAREALANSKEPANADRYFMLLDEMNLARVEHYFSDWLACTESRRMNSDGSIVQQPTSLHHATSPMTVSVHNPDGTMVTLTVPPKLDLPTNLVVTGTVNVDETTYGFSAKVLDRSMVLELYDVDLSQLRNVAQAAGDGGYRFPETLPAFGLATNQDYEKLPVRTHELLSAANSVLKEARLHVGYRAANEMARFMAYYNDMLPSASDPDWLRALDIAILQKLLPRLTGNRAKLELPLARLCAFLRDPSVSTSGNVLNEEFDPTSQAALQQSYRRAVDMLSDLRQFGFVSFFK